MTGGLKMGQMVLGILGAGAGHGLMELVESSKNYLIFH